MTATEDHLPTAPRQRLANFLNSCNRAQLHDAFSQSWLNEIIPGILKIVGCDQGRTQHLEGDVATHTTLVFENMWVVARNRLGRAPSFIELLSTLVHDLQKPATRTTHDDGEVSFPGHEAKAAEDVPAISKALGLSSEEEQQLLFLVARHGEAHGFSALSAVAKRELIESPWKMSLALLQEADARSCLFADGSHLPIYWSELLGDHA